ncbi:MAG: hypothetical protein JSS82_05050 [Bacteroidetes bacterium]|nr:hypothetical protein [Bacteroidota bacterium]
MKQILIALSMVGMISYGANAQSTHSRNDINYRVCRTANGNYKVCSGPYNGVKKTAITTATTQTSNESMFEGSGVRPKSRGRSKYDVNYKVCLVGDQYKVCNPGDPTIQRTSTRSNIVVSSESINDNGAASLSMQQNGAYMGYTSKKRSNIKVEDEDNVRQKLDREADGKEKASYRNMNYNNGSVSLPPNDGGLSDRK